MFFPPPFGGPMVPSNASAEGKHTTAPVRETQPAVGMGTIRARVVGPARTREETLQEDQGGYIGTAVRGPATASGSRRTKKGKKGPGGR